MADESSQAQLHIVAFPWLAIGHMLPFLELSKALARRGHRISFITTRRNTHRLRVPAELSHLISFVALDLPRTEGLREGAEATADLPPEEVPYLKMAFDGLRQQFERFVERATPRPDWIVQDVILHWLPRFASDAGIPCACYLLIPAAALVFFGPPAELASRQTPESMTVPPPWVPFLSKVVYRLHELYQLWEHSRLPNPSGVSDGQRYSAVIEGCDAIAVRSCGELEQEYLSLAETVFKKPVIPVGLPPPSPGERTEGANGATDLAVMDWLERRSSATSVVYVALGTEAAVTTSMLHELAFGLEAAGLPFVWALRRPFGVAEDVDVLPEGFEVRTEGLGTVVRGWVPQVKVLGHRAVGGFLTHCGWSSVVEGLHAGRPLVLLPISLDQGLNARLMAEKGVGVEVEREGDGSFTRDAVSGALRLVVAEEEGEPYRERAREMKEVLARKEMQAECVEDFIQYLVRRRV